MGAMNMGPTKSVIGHGGKSIRVAIGLGVAVLAAAVGCTRLDPRITAGTLLSWTLLTFSYPTIAIVRSRSAFLPET